VKKLTPNKKDNGDRLMETLIDKRFSFPLPQLKEKYV